MTRFSTCRICLWAMATSVIFAGEPDVVGMKAKVDPILVEMRVNMAVGEAYINRIAALGDDYLMIALPELVKAVPLAAGANNDLYRLILLTRVSNAKNVIITKAIYDSLSAVANKEDERQRLCLERIKVRVSD